MNIKHVVVEKECTGCYACVDICPCNAIKFIRDNNGFRVPFVDDKLCVDCGLCNKTCPSLNIKSQENFSTLCYALRASNTIRSKSSSGGAISLFSNYIFNNKGLVFGVTLDKDCNANFISINNNHDLYKINGSNYVLADASNVYKKVKEVLLNGSLVLFTGLPCQINGLYNFLNTSNINTTNLYTVDLLCHGTPSDLIVNIWKNKISNGKGIKEVLYRSKEYGWNCDHVKVVYDDNSVYEGNINNDSFEKLYHNSIGLRDCCYDCKFAELPRKADVSVGDYWGIYNTPEIVNDFRGTSVVFINNNKGLKLLEAIKDNTMLCNQIPAEVNNTNRIFSHIEGIEKTNRFFKLIKNKSLDEATEMTIKPKWDICLLGIPTVENHGSNLTYYAFYKALQHLGYEVLMAERPQYSWWKPHEQPIGFKENPYNPIDWCCLFDNKLQMQKLNDYADTFILGSDQLWNDGLYACFDKFCYLDYIHNNKNKLTYATSFGKDYLGGSKEEKQEAYYYVQGIDNISVRESVGVDICKNEFNKEATVVLDPVFLCPEEEYQKLIVKGESIKFEHFIATYILDPNNKKAVLIENISKKLNLPVINMTDVINQEQQSALWDLETRLNVSNEDWLKAIYDCDFFITDSFHGSCFSIIFQKQFISIGNSYRGLARFNELLNKFCLVDRLIIDLDYYDIDYYINNIINYKQVNEILVSEKEKSINWLENAINYKKDKHLTTYDIIQKDRVNHDSLINWLRQDVDSHGSVIETHDSRITNSELVIRQLQEDVAYKATIINQIQADLDQKQAIIDDNKLLLDDYKDKINYLTVQNQSINNLIISTINEVSSNKQHLESITLQINQVLIKNGLLPRPQSRARDIADKLLPKGSKRREFIKMLCPKDSIQWKFFKKIYRTFDKN